MSNLRPFQIVLMGIFGFLALAGVIAFMIGPGVGGSGDENPYGPEVVIWGTQNSQAFKQTFLSILEEDEFFSVVRYVQKDSRTFNEEFVNAVAEDRGPDAVLLSNEQFLEQRPKLLSISYENFPLRNIQDLYVDGARIFALQEGMYGFPVFADPLVMYWNKDMFASASFVFPPTTWEKLVGDTVPALTVRTNAGDIIKSAIAFGEYRNINNAKEVLLMLMQQAGSTLISQDDVNSFSVNLNGSNGRASRPPADASLDFFTRFSNPSRSEYSWNGSLADDTSRFLSGDLALYFGLGSENARIKNSNPNLNYDVSRIPQGASASTHIGYGEFYSLIPLKKSRNIQGTFNALSVLANDTNANQLASGLGMTPVHRNVLAQGNSNPVDQVLYNSVLVARGWLDPNKSDSVFIFNEMIERVTSGSAKVSDVVKDAEAKLRSLFK